MRSLNFSNSSGAPRAPRSVVRQSARSSVRVAGVGDFVRGLFDFGSWAPRSSRIWRLQQYEPPALEGETAAAAGRADGDTGMPSGGTDSMAVLSDRINQLRDSSSSSSGGSITGSGGVGVGPSAAFDIGAPERSFSDAEDDELSAALSQRVSQIASATGSWSEADESEMRQPLTGEEMRSLMLSKYGKQYDVSFVRRDVPGMKTFVCLNIMWLHLEMTSFKMSEAQYQEKLDSAAALVNALGQTDKVRAFLRAPARSQKGLPRRPVVGTAISIRFDLDQAVIDEWFGQGYD